MLLFAAIIATLSAYFLTHSVTEAKLSTRSFHQSTALNLAEAGVDAAMLDLNNSAIGSATGWRAATDNALSWVRVLGGATDLNYDLGQGYGVVNIRVDNVTATVVSITSCGQVILPNGEALAKQIVVKVAKRPLQGAGLLSRGAITLGSGVNVTVDSYNSAAGVPNPLTNRTDQVIVAADSLTADVNVGGAQVYGYVATGGMLPTVGNHGMVYGATTPAGVAVDPTRERTDFNQNIPTPVAPGGTPINLGAIDTQTLPRAGDIPQPNGRYLYTDSGLGVSLTGNKTLTITGPVDIILTGTMNMSGNGLLSVAGATASLGLYASGNVQIAGNGLANATNLPANATIYGVGPASQTITIAGNGTTTAVVNAPNAAVSVTGNGTIDGAITAGSISFGGNAAFHYDTQLGAVTVSPYYGVKSWIELTDSASGTGAFRRDNRDPFTFL
ncbi:MAG: hypothetical protein ACHQ5A_08830 [Opitutales bacterium]